MRRSESMKWLFAGLLGLSVALGASSVSVAHGKRDPVERMIKHLSLDETQQASVRQILEQRADQRQTMREQRKTLMRKAQALDPNARDYATQSQTLADEAAQLAREKVLTILQVKAELAQVLTPEQMQKMQELVAKRADRMQKRWKHHDKPEA